MSVSVNGPALNISDCPIGGIIMWHTNSIPTGWLECTGQTVQASTYPDLVKTLSGSDTAQSVTLPDMRGVIPAGRGYSPSRSALQNINGNTGLDIGEVIGSTSFSLSITPEHSIDSKAFTVPLRKHTHELNARGFDRNSVNPGGKYYTTPGVDGGKTFGSSTIKYAAYAHCFYGGNYGNGTLADVDGYKDGIYTKEAGTTSSDGKMTITYPSHKTITETIDVRPPSYGICFIIKALAN